MTSPTTNFEKTTFRPAAAWWILFCIASFSASIWLLGTYRSGDQVGYRNFYDAIASLSIWDAYAAQYFHLTSNDAAFTLVMWIGAQIGIPKDIYVAGLNTILAAALVVVLRRFNASIIVIALALTNQYFFVLLTGAERLKLAYVFLIFAFLSNGRTRAVFLALAPTAHTQVMITYLSLFCGHITALCRYLSPHSAISARQAEILAILTVSALAAGAGAVAVVGPTIYAKVAFYAAQAGGVISLVNSVGLSAIGVFVARRKARMFGMMVPIVLVALVIGADRVNMIAYTMFVYALLTDGRINHPLALLPMIYLSFKSIAFMQNVIVYGEGFPLH